MTTEAPIELDAEYRQLREEAAVVRRPTCAVIEVSGSDAVEYLESQLTNEVDALDPGEGRYAALLDRKGHLQSDLVLLLLDPERAWLVAEAEGAERLASHLGTYRIGRQVDIETIDRKVLSVIGPRSGSAVGVEGLVAEHSHAPTEVRDAGEVRAVATDEGVDLLVPSAATDRAIAALAAAGVPEASEGAAEIVRVESGRPRLGREMGPETMPAEAGIVERAVSFSKGCYIGQEPVARLHYKGRPNRRLRALRLDRPASAGDPIQLGDREVGKIGTAVVSPARGPIALAILRREAEPGARVAVGGEGNGGEVVEADSGDVGSGL